MRILFVASRFPYPPSHGDRVRAFHHIRLLSRRHTVVLIVPALEELSEEAIASVERYCERIELVPVSKWKRFVRLASGLSSGLPLQTLYFFDPSVKKRVKLLLEKERFDLLHVQLVRMAPVADGLDARVPLVLDFIDALSVNMGRRSKRERGLLAAITAWESRALLRYEKALTKRYDQLIVSSPFDREVIGSTSNLHVVPNGVDIIANAFQEEEGREPGTIIFTGSMWYFPNVDAITWFAEEVFPLVKQEIPYAHLMIVGANPTAAVQRLSLIPSVTVTGYVTSVPSYLARASVAVAPMQSGSGMQFKVIEAMSSGTPVVATPYALGGLEGSHGEHLMVAEDAKAFASQVVHLLSDAGARRKLAHNARRLVEEKYSWDQTVNTLEKVYELALDSHRVA